MSPKRIILAQVIVVSSVEMRKAQRRKERRLKNKY